MGMRDNLLLLTGKYILALIAVLAMDVALRFFPFTGQRFRPFIAVFPMGMGCFLFFSTGQNPFYPGCL